MTLSVTVVGATGYVGRRVVQALASSSFTEASGPVGLQLLSRNSPSASTFNLPADRYHWQRVDAISLLEQPQKWTEIFKGQQAVVSCLGAFGTSNEFMFKINGSANEAMVRGARDAGVSKFVYISAHAFGIPSVAPWFLPGYFNGKLYAESAIAKAYGGNDAGLSAVVLRPGAPINLTSMEFMQYVDVINFIHGRRQVTEHLTLPLDLVGSPMEKAMKSNLANLPPILHPPVSVDQVAKAVAKAVMEPTGGEISYWDWKEISSV